MNNCVYLKGRELQLLDLFFLIILEMRPWAALECAACVCFFDKSKILGEYPLKIVKPWKLRS